MKLSRYIKLKKVIYLKEGREAKLYAINRDLYLIKVKSRLP